MGKISTYTTASPVVGTDMVIGTSVGGSPADATKNFTINDIGTLVNGEVVKTVEIPISSALTLGTIPYKLLDLPGAGKGIVIWKVIGKIIPGTTVFDFPASLTLRYITGSGVLGALAITSVDFSDVVLNGAATQIIQFKTPVLNVEIIPAHDNMGIGVGVSSGVNPTQGNGKISYTLSYSVV